MNIDDKIKSLSFKSIFTHFNYSVKLHTDHFLEYTYRNNTFIIFKDEDDIFNCYYPSLDKTFDKANLIYFLSKHIDFSYPFFIDKTPEEKLKKSISIELLKNSYYNIVVINDKICKDFDFDLIKAREDIFDAYLFYSADKKVLSVPLHGENKEVCNIIDFNEKIFLARFPLTYGTFTNSNLENKNKFILCFNPYSLIEYFEQKDIAEYFYLISASNFSFSLITKIDEYFNNNSFSSLDIIMGSNITEGYLIIKYLSLLITAKTPYFCNIEKCLHYISFSLRFPDNIKTLEVLNFVVNLQDNLKKIIFKGKISDMEEKTFLELNFSSSKLSIDNNIIDISIPLKIEAIDLFIKHSIEFFSLKDITFSNSQTTINS